MHVQQIASLATSKLTGFARYESDYISPQLALSQINCGLPLFSLLVDPECVAACLLLPAGVIQTGTHDLSVVVKGVRTAEAFHLLGLTCPSFPGACPSSNLV